MPSYEWVASMGPTEDAVRGRATTAPNARRAASEQLRSRPDGARVRWARNGDSSEPIHGWSRDAILARLDSGIIVGWVEAKGALTYEALRLENP